MVSQWTTSIGPDGFIAGNIESRYLQGVAKVSRLAYIDFCQNVWGYFSLLAMISDGVGKHGLALLITHGPITSWTVTNSKAYCNALC